MKMGFKGNTKKNSLKIENFAVVWETSPNLLITNKILNEEIKKEKWMIVIIKWLKISIFLY
jgi:hypothetical protein